MSLPIMLKDILPIEGIGDYKVHFARHNGEVEPLDDWLEDNSNWVAWQQYRPKKDEFNRDFIFSLMKFYPEEDVWLFGGIFQKLADHGDRYKVELKDHGKALVGRLKIYRPWRNMATRVNLENHYDFFVVSEVLREAYTGRAFPGFEYIDLPFSELETLVRNDRPDWRAALENVKGVYLITDIKTGKRYVGQASGGQGIWSRWREYAESGHGGNKELKKLVGDERDYAREHFKFTLLEYYSDLTSDEIVSKREGYWKEVLLTRGKFGLNQN